MRQDEKGRISVKDLAGIRPPIRAELPIWGHIDFALPICERGQTVRCLQVRGGPKSWQTHSLPSENSPALRVFEQHDTPNHATKSSKKLTKAECTANNGFSPSYSNLLQNVKIVPDESAQIEQAVRRHIRDRAPPFC